MLPGGDRANSAPAPLEDNFFDASVGRLSTVTAAAMNCRNSTKLRRYDNTDSAPLFSLARSGCRPSEQLPVTGSTSAVCRSFLPRNQSNARPAASDHSSPPVAQPITPTIGRTGKRIRSSISIQPSRTWKIFVTGERTCSCSCP